MIGFRRTIRATLLGIGLLTGLFGCAPAISVVVENSLTPTPPPSSPSIFRVIIPSLFPRPESPLSAPPIQLSERQQIFETVWQLVNEHYLYPDFRGQNWPALHSEFEPKVAAAKDNAEFYALLKQLIKQLGDQHSRFLAPPEVITETNSPRSNEGNYGIGVIERAMPDDILIQQVFPNSPAAQVGLKPRDRVLTIDGQPYAPGMRLQGPAGSKVRLTLFRPGEGQSDVVLLRQAVEGRLEPTIRRFENEIGYLGITTFWADDLATQVSAALTDLVVEKPLRGLIIDLRGNPGGWREVLIGLLSHFVQGEVGSFFDRSHATPLLIKESQAPDLQDLPLVILIDQATASYAELFAAILQAEVGAKVIGTPSAGNTETIYSYDLPTGTRLWLAQEGFSLKKGENLEGRGVQPDLLLDVDGLRFSEATDPQILAARQLLNEKIMQQKQP